MLAFFPCSYARMSVTRGSVGCYTIYNVLRVCCLTFRFIEKLTEIGSVKKLTSMIFGPVQSPILTWDFFNRRFVKSVMLSAAIGSKMAQIFMECLEVRLP